MGIIQIGNDGSLGLPSSSAPHCLFELVKQLPLLLHCIKII